MDFKTIDEATAACIANGGNTILIAWTGMGYALQPVSAKGFGGCLIGHSVDVDKMVADAAKDGYRYGMIVYIDGR